MKLKYWQLFAFITTITWGVWGALIEFPAKWNFPETLGYCMWAFTMVPCAIIALYIVQWKLDYDRRSIILGSIIGFFGAGGQLLLFRALRGGPAYVIFPIISLYPVLTIILSVFLLKESTKFRGKIGILLALIAIGFLSYMPPSDNSAQGYSWLLFSTFVFILWGAQAYVMKFANNTMKAESIFFYMMATSVLLSPVAYQMTDFSQSIEWGLRGPVASFLIQSLNSIGALFLVYALRYGKAIIVVPMTSMAPVITIVISLCIYRVLPHPVVLTGLVLASIAIFLLSEE